MQLCWDGFKLPSPQLTVLHMNSLGSWWRNPLLHHQIRFPWETEVILMCRKPKTQYFPPFYYSVSRWLKIKTFQDSPFFFFSFPSRLLAWAVNSSLSISTKAAEEWLFWAYMECLTAPKLSVFLAGKPPGHAPQAAKHPLLFSCPSSTLKAWFQALRLDFFSPSQTIFCNAVENGHSHHSHFIATYWRRCTWRFMWQEIYFKLNWTRLPSTSFPYTKDKPYLKAQKIAL